MTYDKVEELERIQICFCDLLKLGEHYDPEGERAPRELLQMDLDEFHRCGAGILDWDELIDEYYPPPDERTPEEKRADWEADQYDKG